MISQVRACLKLPDLTLDLRDVFGSKNSNHRLEIRQAILNLSPNDTEILNLDALPVIPGKQISISHTQSIGGFAMCSGLNPIGFDIELTSRIKASQLTRVNRYQEESKLAPGPNFLWTAKEAGFKAASSRHQLRTLSDVVIKGWSEINSGLWCYENDFVIGLTYNLDEFTLSIALEKA